LAPADAGHRFQPDTSRSGAVITGQCVGYTRVSTLDRNTDRQLDGIDIDRTFTDHVSGKDLHRPQLEVLLAFVRDGGTVLVHSTDRLARNLDDLRATVRGLTTRGVRVQFVKEQLTFTGDDTAMATLLLTAWLQVDLCAGLERLAEARARNASATSATVRSGGTRRLRRCDRECVIVDGSGRSPARRPRRAHQAHHLRGMHSDHRNAGAYA